MATVALVAKASVVTTPHISHPLATTTHLQSMSPWKMNTPDWIIHANMVVGIGYGKMLLL